MSPFPLYSPPNVHGDTTRFRALSLPYFIHLSIASLSITLRIVAQGMRVVSPSRSGIVSGGRYVLLHKQRIIEVDLCCMLVVCSCMAYPLPVGSPVSHQTYQYIHILAHLPVRMRLHDLLDSTTGVQSWRHGWVWSALQESFVFGCQVVRAMGCSRWGWGRGCLVVRCAVRRVWVDIDVGRPGPCVDALARGRLEQHQPYKKKCHWLSHAGTA